MAETDNDVELLACWACGSAPVKGRRFREDKQVHCSKIDCYVFNYAFDVTDWNTRHPTAAAPSLDAWRPIETAPKDGRTLLLGYLNPSGRWRTTRGQWFTKDQIDDEWDNGEDFDADWYETSIENDEPPNCWLIAPTHWMPLPAPPDAPTPTQPETPPTKIPSDFISAKGEIVDWNVAAPEPPDPAADERETLIYWLLRCYESGHRQGWEAGPSMTETMDSLLHVLANRGYDPNEDEAAKELLKRKARF